MPVTKSTPPNGSHRSSEWWDREMDKKADQQWVESERDRMFLAIEQAKSIAKEAKRKAEERHVKVGTIVSLLVLLLAGVAQYYSLKDKVEDTSEAVIELKSFVTEIKVDVDEVSQAMETHLRWTADQEQVNTKNDKKQLEAIASVVKDAIKEANGRNRK